MMTRSCDCCGGRCGDDAPLDLSRRTFLGRLAVGAAGVAFAEQLAAAVTAPLPPLATPAAGWPAYPHVPPRVYREKNLQAVSMPIGGIGTGSIWLNGQGCLQTWQIFNNLSEITIPDSFFAIRVRAGDKTVARVLQTVGDATLEPVAGLEYEGGYPIARLKYADAALPVNVALEAFNPLIPLDTLNSSIPCALFRFTVHNPGSAAAEVSLAATLQNAVGSQGAKGIQGVRHSGYGGNRNQALHEAQFTAVALDQLPDPVHPGPIRVRNARGEQVLGPEMLWLSGAGGYTGEVADALARIAGEGGVAVVEGVTPAFLQSVAALRGPQIDLATVGEVFEDFERDNYDGWTLTGNAFGKAPAQGTMPGQQPVSGFAGKRLVNTFLHGDLPQGTATSRTFRITRRYIGFLIGGGKFPQKTCVNLLVDGKVVRTAVGKNHEALEPATWDVGDLHGKDAAIEIVDRATEGWGHINVDQIVFSDLPPEVLLRKGTAMQTAAQALQLKYTAAHAADLPAAADAVLAPGVWGAAAALCDSWSVKRVTHLDGFQPGENGYRVLASAPGGDPLVIEGPLGKGRVVIVLAPGLPWSWGRQLAIAARGRPLQPGERVVPGGTGQGTMTLAALAPDAATLTAWTTGDEFAAFLADPTAKQRGAAAVSKPGETLNAALAVPFTLQPGESRSVTFVLAWHFPNVQRFQHPGNLYARRWLDAPAVARYVAANFDALHQRTLLYHQTVYQSNLPEEFLDAITSQSVILRGPTCFWSEDGYFGGFEGSYGCCPLNCTHVWNYAQSHARLFPEVGRNMRVSNFITFLHETGETSHREHAPHKAFIDGHCACIVAALREHQLSADNAFLQRIWPGVKLAVEWLIGAIDDDHDGVPAGWQWNTYDTAVSGANTFIGSQYLAALAAGEQLALAMREPETAARWASIRRAGTQNQDRKLWNGEYYIQLPEPKSARDYGPGCAADQLLGQWWAHMLNLGYLYPREHVRAALESVRKYNFRATFAGFPQVPRRYIPDDEGGLLICTWPQGGRPKSFMLYSDEVWTGIEYAAAAAMLFEGLTDAARCVVRMARSRYDGRRRDNLNSGPGGNPFNELECGKFYARAMSSWSLLIAAQGLILDGPQGILGFQPRWQPEDHRSFFTAPEGWGLFVQRREDKRQTARIEVRHGQVRVRELVFALPGRTPATATVQVAGAALPASVKQEGEELRVLLEKEVLAGEGTAVEVVLQWA